MRALCYRVFAFTTFLVLFSGFAHAQKGQWISQCASVPTDPTKPPNLCSFLIDSYKQIDNRCGFAFGKAWYKEWPWGWFKPTHEWDIIPSNVIQNIPLRSTDINQATWQLFQLPALARLMTVGFASDDQSTPPPLTDIEDSSKSLVALHFNPLLAPVAMIDGGKSHFARSLTCTNALQASQNGKVSFSVASASEKFSSQENDSASATLVYGTFVSPMATDRMYHPDRFYFESLAWYEDYLRTVATKLPSSVKYIQSVEGLILYNAVQSSLASNINATADATYSVPLASISGSVDETNSLANTATANLFYALLRGKTGESPSYSTLPQSDDVVSWLSAKPIPSWTKSHGYQASAIVLDPRNHAQEASSTCSSGSDTPTWNDSGGTTNDGNCVWADMGSGIAASPFIRLDNSLSKAAAWNATNHDVEATFVIEGMPSVLCKASLWQIKLPDSFSLDLSAPVYHSVSSLLAAATAASASANTISSACVWTITTTNADGTMPISGWLQFSDPNLPVQLPFIIPYSVNIPQLQFVSPDKLLTGTPSSDGTYPITAGFWYQVASPNLLDTTQAISVDDATALTCDNNPISGVVRTVNLAAAYAPNNGGATISGTYFHVQAQWTDKKTPTTCSLKGAVDIVTKTGAPAKAKLSTN